MVGLIVLEITQVAGGGDVYISVAGSPFSVVSRVGISHDIVIKIQIGVK